MRALTLWTRIWVFTQADLILTRIRINARPYSVNTYLCVAAYQRRRDVQEVPLALVVTRAHNNDFRFVNFLFIFLSTFICWIFFLRSRGSPLAIDSWTGNTTMSIGLWLKLYVASNKGWSTGSAAGKTKSCYQPNTTSSTWTAQI